MGPDNLPDPVVVAISFARLLERLRCAERIRMSADDASFVFADTAEHTVLRKLEWYRRGAEVSDRQWRDAIAILRIQSGRLDRTRLNTWAERLNVSDLLRRAWDAAGRS